MPQIAPRQTAYDPRHTKQKTARTYAQIAQDAAESALAAQTQASATPREIPENLASGVWCAKTMRQIGTLHEPDALSPVWGVCTQWRDTGPHALEALHFDDPLGFIFYSIGVLEKAWLATPQMRGVLARNELQPIWAWRGPEARLSLASIGKFPASYLVSCSSAMLRLTMHRETVAKRLPAKITNLYDFFACLLISEKLKTFIDATLIEVEAGIAHHAQEITAARAQALFAKAPANIARTWTGRRAYQTQNVDLTMASWAKYEGMFGDAFVRKENPQEGDFGYTPAPPNSNIIGAKAKDRGPLFDLAQRKGKATADLKNIFSQYLEGEEAHDEYESDEDDEIEDNTVEVSVLTPEWNFDEEQVFAEIAQDLLAIDAAYSVPPIASVQPVAQSQQSQQPQAKPSIFGADRANAHSTRVIKF